MNELMRFFFHRQGIGPRNNRVDFGVILCIMKAIAIFFTINQNVLNGFHWIFVTDWKQDKKQWSRFWGHPVSFRARFALSECSSFYKITVTIITAAIQCLILVSQQKDVFRSDRKPIRKTMPYNLLFNKRRTHANISGNIHNRREDWFSERKQKSL